MTHALRQVRWFLEWAAAWPWLFACTLLTDAAAEAVARILGPIVCFFLPVDRRRCLANLKLAFGDHLDDAGRARLTRDVFTNLVRTFLEVLRWSAADADRHVVMDDRSERDLARIAGYGRGGLGVSVHLGNFELFSRVLSKRGIANRMMTRPLDNPFLENFLAARRKRLGTTPVSRDAAGLREVLRGIKRGELIGMAVDLNSDAGVFVNFLGIPASAPAGAGELAVKMNLPVGLITAHRLGDGRHEVIVRELAPVRRTGDRAADVASAVQAYTDALTPYIIAHPQEYHFQYNRWRVRPAGEPPGDLAALRTAPAPAPWTPVGST